MNETLIQNNLKSSNPKIRESVFLFLERSGNITHLKMILEHIKIATDKYEKQSAIRAAAAIIKRNLLENFSELKSKMRRSLAQILKTLDPGVIDTIAEDLKSEDPDMRFNAIRVLGLMGKNARIKELVKKLIKDRNQLVRATSISLMRKMMEHTDVQLISSLLNDKDERVVANCIECVEALNVDRLSPLLLRFKGHSNNRVRGNALKALWKVSGTDVFKDIEDMCLNHDNYLMRATACWVIGECAGIKDLRYMQLLANLGSDEEKLVRQNVIKAQLKIGGEAMEAYLKKQANPEELQEAKEQLNR